MSGSDATREAPGSGRKSGAETARKVLSVLLAFSVQRPTASVRELAAEADLPLGTAHRYVALLRDLGLLEEAGRGTYQLGWRAVQLGHAAMETAGVLPIAEPVMRRLVAQTDESVTVFRRVELEMEVIGQIESPHVMRLTFHPGQRLKLSAGASARVLLSGVPDDGLEEVLDGLCAVDPSFRARRAEFAADVRRTRERGWTTSREEIDSGVWAVAAPLHVDGRVVASLAVAGPLHRHDADAERRTVELLRQAAAEIDRALAARGVS